MAESQSRKLAEMSNLAHIQEEAEKNQMRFQEKINVLTAELNSKQANYKFEHEQWKAKKLADIKIRHTLQIRFKREIENLQEDITLRDENYEYDFQRWAAIQKSNIEAFKKNKAANEKRNERAIFSKNCHVHPLSQIITRTVAIGLRAKTRTFEFEVPVQFWNCKQKSFLVCSEPKTNVLG